MNIIYNTARSGKSTELVQLSHQFGYYIVCANHDRVDNLVEISNQLNLKIPFPLTFNEFLNKEYSSHITLLIDDADDLIRYLSKSPIHSISITKES